MANAQRISQLCWMFFLKIIDDQDQELELLKAAIGLQSPRSSNGVHGRPIPKESPVTSCSPL